LFKLGGAETKKQLLNWVSLRAFKISDSYQEKNDLKDIQMTKNVTLFHSLLKTPYSITLIKIYSKGKRKGTASCFLQQF